MPKLTIDGQEIEVAPGASVLQACEQLGIEIPRFCYHDRLTVAGSCRMCLVEVEKMPKPVASCALPCADGMVVHTNTQGVQEARQDVMEMLLINHPLDCPVCDQGGECDLQDIAFAYGHDRSRMREPRRRVKDKELGPLIQTNMTRCIHCTRCIRFMAEIAGSPELGGIGRGEKLEITPCHEGPLLSELSGNLVDICPVGALTSKPYAFQARPWELTKTDSIDVLDAVGCNIRVDSRGGEVLRIVPRLHEEINEVWLGDKSRFACDGLKRQRLDRPYVRGNKDGYLRPASWAEAMDVIAKRLHNLLPERVAALAGNLADCESLFALRELMRHLDSPHLDCRLDGAVYDSAVRAGTIMNSGIAGIEEADAILLIGTNPRHEGTLVNARIFKRWSRGGSALGFIGASAPLGYPVEHIGYSPLALRELLEGKHAFAKALEKARKPLLILGAGALARPDGLAIQFLARQIAERFGMIQDDWNGFNVLQRAASRVGALDLGFVPGTYGMNTHQMIQAAEADKLDALYLLGADELDMSRLGKTFVIYQGHHGDAGAARADVVLPGAAYTEKDALYVNTEGRAQWGRRAVFPLGEAKEDAQILLMVAQALGKKLSFDDVVSLRKKMAAGRPWFDDIGQRVAAPWKDFGQEGKLSLEPFELAVPNYYMTDVISRCSPTMAKCAREILPLIGGEGA